MGQTPTSIYQKQRLFSPLKHKTCHISRQSLCQLKNRANKNRANSRTMPIKACQPQVGLISHLLIM